MHWMRIGRYAQPGEPSPSGSGSLLALRPSVVELAAMTTIAVDQGQLFAPVAINLEPETIERLHDEATGRCVSSCAVILEAVNAGLWLWLCGQLDHDHGAKNCGGNCQPCSGRGRNPTAGCGRRETHTYYTISKCPRCLQRPTATASK